MFFRQTMRGGGKNSKGIQEAYAMIIKKELIMKYVIDNDVVLANFRNKIRNTITDRATIGK